MDERCDDLSQNLKQTFKIATWNVRGLKYKVEDLSKNPKPEIFQIPERNPKIFRSNNEEEMDVSNQNLMLKTINNRV